MNEEIRLPKQSTPGDGHFTDYQGGKIDVYQLIDRANEIEVTEMPLMAFKDVWQNHYWHDSQGAWLGPYNVIEAVNGSENIESLMEDESLDIELRKHIRKVLDANYETYPIIMINDQVVDGIHRLTKAFLDKAENINVKRFEEMPENLLETSG